MLSFGPAKAALLPALKPEQTCLDKYRLILKVMIDWKETIPHNKATQSVTISGDKTRIYVSE